MQSLNIVHQINCQSITQIERNQIIMMLGKGMELRGMSSGHILNISNILY